MIEIKDLIKNTLQPLNVPVKFQVYSGKEKTYITFFEYIGQSEAYADDEETETGHYIQVDIWSNDDYTAIVQQTKLLLKQAGFRRTYETELTENNNGTQIFHKVLRVFYCENNDIEEE